MSMFQDSRCVYVPGQHFIVDMIHHETGRTRYGGKTIDDALAEHPGAVVMDFDEACRQIEQAQRNKYCTGPHEITVERYDEMLDILPPGGFGEVRGALVFFVIEAITGDLHDWFCKIGNRYFTICESRCADREYITGRCAELMGRTS